MTVTVAHGDERARGKSKRSADYSFEAAVRDADAVLSARGVERALAVGWSYGPFVAAHWASRNPDRASARSWLRARNRTTGSTRRWGSGSGSCFGGRAGSCRCWRPTSLTPRMTAKQQADSNIDIGELARERELGPVLPSTRGGAEDTTERTDDHHPPSPPSSSSTHFSILVSNEL